MRQSDAIKTFFSLVAPGFTLDGELPAVELEGIEERHDGHVLGIRFTFDEGMIARVEVL